MIEAKLSKTAFDASIYNAPLRETILFYRFVFLCLGCSHLLQNRRVTIYCSLSLSLYLILLLSIMYRNRLNVTHPSTFTLNSSPIIGYRIATLKEVSVADYEQNTQKTIILWHWRFVVPLSSRLLLQERYLRKCHWSECLFTCPDCLLAVVYGVSNNLTH